MNILCTRSADVKILSYAEITSALGGRIYVFAKGIDNKRIYVNSALDGQPFDGWGGGWSEAQ